MRDNGKLLSEMAAQLRYVPSIYHYYAGLADKIEGSVVHADKPAFTFTRHEPLGVCVGIIPWNSPLMLVAWKLGPALAAGNTMVLKPSEYTSASALAFVKLVEQAGFPRGVVNVVTGFGPEAGQPLVEHPLVRKVAFTGSDRTGAHLYSTAARDIKRVSLELGGKSPNIVFADANLDNAVKGAVAGIFAATGQTCIAGSRLLVQRSIHDEFVERLVAFAGTAKMGNPMSLETQVGPVTNLPQFEKVLGYIDVAKGEGAETVLGGARAERPECGEGWFVEPTIFTACGSRRKRCSARCSRSSPSRTTTRRWPSATTSSSASRPGCGRRTCAGPSRCRSAAGRHGLGQTCTGRSATPCPSAVTSAAASGGSSGSRRSWSTCRPRACGSRPRRRWPTPS